MGSATRRRPRCLAMATGRATFPSVPPPRGKSAIVTAQWAEGEGLWPIAIHPIDSTKTANPGKAPIGKEWGKTRRGRGYLSAIYKHNPTAGAGLVLGID